jgi:protein TonB
MFNNLIESKRKKERSAGGAAFSVVMHVALGAAIVVVTANAGQQLNEKAKQEEVKFIDVKPKQAPPPPEPPKAPPPPQAVNTPPPPKGFQVLTAPINIPDKIPDVDLSKSVTDENDFSGKGVEGGTSKGVVGGTGPVKQDQPYFEFQVDKPALAREGNPAPVYPEAMQQAGIAGEVLAQFVVDTSGRAEMGTFKVLKSTNDAFTLSVKRALPAFRFYPAQIGDRKVKVLAQQNFTFAPH